MEGEDQTVNRNAMRKEERGVEGEIKKVVILANHVDFWHGYTVEHKQRPDSEQVRIKTANSLPSDSATGTRRLCNSCSKGFT